MTMVPRLPSALSEELIPDWVCADEAAPPYSPTPPPDMPIVPDLTALGYATAMRWSMHESQARAAAAAQGCSGWLDDEDDAGVAEPEDDARDDVDADDATLHDHDPRCTLLSLPYPPEVTDIALPCAAPFSYSCPWPDTCPCSLQPHEDSRRSRFSIRLRDHIDVAIDFSGLAALDEQLIQTPHEAFAELCYSQAIHGDIGGPCSPGASTCSDAKSLETLRHHVESVETSDSESESDCDSVLDPELKPMIAAQANAASPRRPKRTVCTLHHVDVDEPLWSHHPENEALHVSFLPSAPPAIEIEKTTLGAQGVLCCLPVMQRPGAADGVGSFPTRRRSEHHVRSGVLRAFAGFRSAFTGS
ncbi:hypothetical protein CERSUDRAFT_118272 [Gelatoporia subvermispora B]|uniref:Uncharacterized protein n=1 Tax=Ceriporiopsis subvermispora (strain B) TaxID=914234 RepID=M2R4U4_CERS8|nr:hypothetical protein CERSUDRAFT_118272 [Gelatoporia subvermispora B]